MPMVTERRQQGIQVHQWTVCTDVALLEEITTQAALSRKARTVYLRELLEDAIRRERRNRNARAA